MAGCAISSVPRTTEYRHTMAESLILCGPNTNPNPKFFVEIMVDFEKMDKGLTVPKLVLINRPKIPQMPQNCSAEFVSPSQKVWVFRKKLSTRP